ncbi:MAG: class I SAM-dependent methyltransferase [Spirochaetales bacterium]|nr:class I SAM-dependent methyltransferase [Spirochaetales bacterium]MCF7949412.1 class I SAM-dependent methyltransferase [Spirochaetia bacterium]MCF7951594.1 class I SAM-dependent methyltransferase [Spirochaetaceae bacterium]
MDKEIEKRCVFSPTQRVELESVHKRSQRILDIGGGGEGIIGKLYGANVVAIDKRANELYETNNDSLKIEMDAAQMGFVDNSFDVVTIFFTLLYMPADVKQAVLKESLRVLKNGGVLEIWDAFVPKYEQGEKDIFVADLEIVLPEETIHTQYGSLMGKEAQTDAHIRDWCTAIGLQVVDSFSNNVLFHLIFQK